MNEDNKFIRFDWAAKRMLRDKGNFGVLEGRAEGRAEGLAEGLAVGRAEGAADAARDNARRMKADNMPLEMIVKYTGLTADEIETL